jgi:hypothetical protein
MKSLFSKSWPYLVAIIGLMVFAFFYFSPENTDGLSLPQSDVQHSLSMQREAKKFQAQEDREILWTDAMFSGMPTYQITGVTGATWNGVAKVMYQAMKMFKPTTSPTGLMFSWLLGFFIMMLCFRFDWKYALLGALVFGVSTSLMLLVDSGHVNKVFVLGLLPPTLGGIWLIYRGKYLLGAAMTALFINLQIMANHLQISYYFAFLVFFLVIGLFIQALKEKKVKDLVIASSILIGAVLIGVLPNLPRLLTTKEYAEESIRGKTELTKTDKPADGLSKDYAYGWSMSIPESMTHIIPNYLGGSSLTYFAQDPESKSLQYLQTLKPEEGNQLAQATTDYFGEQAFVSGAWYWGISVVFLFFIAFFSTRHWIRWWGLGSIAFLLMLSWGNHFSLFNYFLFDHFPLFNKFRAVSMSVNLAHMVLVLVGMYGMREFFKNSPTQRLTALKWAGSIIGALLILGFAHAWMGSLNSKTDVQLTQYPELLRALRSDRSALVSADTFRSLIFVLLIAGLIYLAAKDKIKQIWVLAGLGLLILIDVIGVDRRYLPNSKFTSDYTTNEEPEPRTVDKQILADPQISFRVMDFSNTGRRNPFADAFPSNFYQNVGGYHAAKLGIYQDIIEKYLGNPAKYMHIYNMLNTKYFIAGESDNLVARKNPGAMGNAWFASSMKLVDNADAELAALEDSTIAQHVVVNKRFANFAHPDKIQFDSTATVSLTKYIPDDLTYTYNAATPQFLVFSEIYYPEAKGWHVYIDGKRKEGIVRTNYVLRGIEVPAGKHTLEMKLEPYSYYGTQIYGKIGNLILILLIAAGVWFALKPYFIAEKK